MTILETAIRTAGFGRRVMESNLHVNIVLLLLILTTGMSNITTAKEPAPIDYFKKYGFQLNQQNCMAYIGVRKVTVFRDCFSNEDTDRLIDLWSGEWQSFEKFSDRVEFFPGSQFASLRIFPSVAEADIVGVTNLIQSPDVQAKALEALEKAGAVPMASFTSYLSYTTSDDKRGEVYIYYLTSVRWQEKNEVRLRYLYNDSCEYSFGQTHEFYDFYSTNDNLGSAVHVIQAHNCGILYVGKKLNLDVKIVDTETEAKSLRSNYTNVAAFSVEKKEGHIMGPISAEYPKGFIPVVKYQARIYYFE